MKKLLSMLVVLCMIVSLLPMIPLQAAAETPTSTKINFNGDGGKDVTETPAYYTTNAAGRLMGGTESNWNVKTQMVDGVAVVTLKNAQIGHYNAETGAYTLGNDKNALSGHESYGAAPVKIVVEADSTIAASAHLINSNNSMMGLTIESKDNAKLLMQFSGAYQPISTHNQDVEFVNANVEIVCTAASQYAGNINCKNLTINNSTLKVLATNYQQNKHTIIATGAVIIEKSNVELLNKVSSAVQAPTVEIKDNSVVTMNADMNVLTFTDALTVTDSELTVFANSGLSESQGISNVIFTENGIITIENAKLTAHKKVQSYTFAHVISITGAGQFNVKGDNSEVTLHTNSVKNAYALNMPAGGTATISGGTVKMDAYEDTVNAPMGTGAVNCGTGSSLNIAGGDVTLKSGVSIVTGEVNITGGTFTALSKHHIAASSQLFTVAPTVDYTGEHYIVLGAAADGSDIEICTDTEDATVSGYRYFKVAAGPAPEIDNDDDNGGNEGGNEGGNQGGNQGGSQGGNQGGSNKPDDTNKPTGDNTDLVLLASLLSISVLGLGAVLVLNKKNAAC